MDILFLDIEMPGEDGIQTGKRLRERGSECKIIMATSMAERFKEGYHIGASRFVTKPFDQEEVEEELDKRLFINLIFIASITGFFPTSTT